MERCQRNQHRPSVHLPGISVPPHLPCLTHLDVNVDWPPEHQWREERQAQQMGSFNELGNPKTRRASFIETTAPSRGRVPVYTRFLLQRSLMHGVQFKVDVFTFSGVRCSILSGFALVCNLLCMLHESTGSQAEQTVTRAAALTSVTQP